MLHVRHGPFLLRTKPRPTVEASTSMRGIRRKFPRAAMFHPCCVYCICWNSALCEEFNVTGVGVTPFCKTRRHPPYRKDKRPCALDESQVFAGLVMIPTTIIPTKNQATGKSSEQSDLPKTEGPDNSQTPKKSRVPAKRMISAVVFISPIGTGDQNPEVHGVMNKK